MRCSSCEPLLDRYVEGTLTARQKLEVAAHLRVCAQCRALLDELKAIDALLVTSSTAELPANFTFALMAEVHALPAARSRQHPIWSFLALYSAAAWVAFVAGIVLSGTSPSAVWSAVSSALGSGGATAAAFADSVSRGFSHAMPGLAAFGAGVLIVDVAIAAAAAALYFLVRPRLAAQLATPSETYR